MLCGQAEESSGARARELRCFSRKDFILKVELRRMIPHCGQVPQWNRLPAAGVFLLGFQVPTVSAPGLLFQSGGSGMSPLAPHMQPEPQRASIPWVPVGFGGALLACLVIYLFLPVGKPAEPVAVAGTVTWRGRGVAGGTIVFAPDHKRGHAGPLGMGVIDFSGHYEIQSEDRPGLMPGWYVVTVAPSGAVSPLGWPYKYHHPESSGLGCEVKWKGNAAFDFNLE